MSVPAQYSQRGVSEHKEDCRDYLRTGRCKYGASCKYNHPPNVQSGGGMKAPIDPSEPMFPIRPNEPVCQYFMKHGTCKFGQTCKFHHPPQSSIASTMVNGNTILMSVGRKNDGQQILWNPSSGDGLQMLPQRPDEPNCIFFLKNGRCKYGATCRYHHPLNFHERRQGDDTRRQPVQAQQVPSDALHQSKVHYMASMPSKAYQHGHFVVSDGAVTFVSLDGSSPTQVISVPPSNGNSDSKVSYLPQGSSTVNHPLGLSREVASSSSSASIASSFDTCGSSADPLASHGDSSGGLWNRSKISNGGSINHYSVMDSNGRPHMMTHGNRVMVGQGSIDSNVSLSHGTLSHGGAPPKASENNRIYYDNNTSVNRSVTPQMQSNGGSKGVTWRGKRSSSFDYTRSSTPSHYNQPGEIHKSTSVPDGLGDDSSQRSPMMRGRTGPLTGHRSQGRSQQSAEVDDGLSMMTSALLTMLDTPEEAAIESYDDGLDVDDSRGSTSQMSTPRMRPQYAVNGGANSVPQNPRTMNYHSNLPYMPSPSYIAQGNPLDDHVLGLTPTNRDGSHMHYQNHNTRIQKSHIQLTEDSPTWSPPWQGSNLMARPLQENGQAVSVMQSQPPSNSPHGSSHVGLYLL